MSRSMPGMVLRMLAMTGLVLGCGTKNTTQPNDAGFLCDSPTANVGSTPLSQVSFSIDCTLVNGAPDSGAVGTLNN